MLHVPAFTLVLVFGGHFGVGLNPLAITSSLYTQQHCVIAGRSAEAQSNQVTDFVCVPTGKLLNL